MQQSPTAAETSIHCVIPDVYVGTDILASDEDLEVVTILSGGAREMRLRDADGNWQTIPRLAHPLLLKTIERHDPTARAAIAKAEGR